MSDLKTIRPEYWPNEPNSPQSIPPPNQWGVDMSKAVRLATKEDIERIEHRLDEIERAVIAMYKRGFAGDSLSLVEMAPLLERVKLLALEVKQG